MRGILERYLQPPAPPAYRVRDCRLTHVRQRDGSRFSVQYDVRFEVPETGRVWDRVVSGVSFGGSRTRRAWEEARDTVPAPPAIEADQPALPPFAYVPDLDMLVQVFPHDHGLPALARLVAGPPPELLPALLAGFGPGEWAVLAWEAEPVRYRLGIRAALRLGIRVGDAAAGRVAERNAYAKVYGDAEKGRQGAHAQRDLHDRAAAGAAFAVAEPIAYVERLQTLVQGEVGGVSLHALLRQQDDPTPALRAAARAVAGFHRLDLAAPPRRAGKEIPRPLRKAQERLRSERPDLAREVAGLLEAVAVGLGGVPPGPTHGDLKPNHILLDGDRVALIDFDDLAEGDPLRDVANLVAQLAQIRSDDQAGTAVRVFLDEYLAHAPATCRARLPTRPTSQAAGDGEPLRRRGKVRAKRTGDAS